MKEKVSTNLGPTLVLQRVGPLLADSATVAWFLKGQTQGAWFPWTAQFQNRVGTGDHLRRIL